jgi:hypothetical protein
MKTILLVTTNRSGKKRCRFFRVGKHNVDGGWAAMLVYGREISLGTPAYFVALDFDGDRVVLIHDFLYARYAMDGVDLSPLNRKALSQ